MPRHPIMTKSSVLPKPDDRREWLRIDERLLLDYRLLDESAGMAASSLPPLTRDMISTLVNQPTADLLAHEVEAIVSGKLGADGVFYADENGLLLRCPTRYEEALPGQANG